ncbi:Ig-like domain-containing protein, partial [Campylobacter gastrosuis]
KVDPDTGKITIPADKIEDGSEVTAKTEDKAGNVSDEGKVVAGDTTAPVVDITEVTPVDTNSNGTPDKTKISVETNEPNAPIVFKDEQGNELGRGTTDANGNFTGEIKPVNPGDKVIAEVTDPSGNTGTDTQTAGNLTTDDKDAPVVDITEVTPVDTNSNGTPDKTKISVETNEPNAPIVFKDEQGNELGRGTTDANGNFTGEIKPVNPGDKVIAEVTDPSGNTGKDTEVANGTLDQSPHAELDVSSINYRGDIELPFARDIAIKNAQNIGADQKLKVTLIGENGNEIASYIRNGNDQDAWGRKTLAEMAAVKEYKLDLVDTNGNVIQTLDTKPVSLSDVVITDVIDDVAGGKDGKLQSGDFTN